MKPRHTAPAPRTKAQKASAEFQRMILTRDEPIEVVEARRAAFLAGGGE